MTQTEAQPEAQPRIPYRRGWRHRHYTVRGANGSHRIAVYPGGGEGRFLALCLTCNDHPATWAASEIAQHGVKESTLLKRVRTHVGC
jgi:hypothetical protein